MRESKEDLTKFVSLVKIAENLPFVASAFKSDKEIKPKSSHRVKNQHYNDMLARLTPENFQYILNDS